MKQNIKTIIITTGEIIGVATSVFFLTFIVLAWTGPQHTPPTCESGEVGCDVVIHTGSAAQSKVGGLLLNTGGAEYGLIVDKGKVGINETLEVSGGLKINSTGETPTCNEANRGMMWIEQGDEGEGDEIVTCTKDTSNDYNFVSLSKSNQSKPSAPTLASSTTTSITLGTILDGEYRVDGGEWQDSPEFTGLTIESDYTFEQRYKGTETLSPSPPSDPKYKRYISGTNPTCDGSVLWRNLTPKTCSDCSSCSMGGWSSGGLTCSYATGSYNPGGPCSIYCGRALGCDYVNCVTGYTAMIFWE